MAPMVSTIKKNDFKLENIKEILEMKKINFLN